MSQLLVVEPPGERVVSRSPGPGVRGRARGAHHLSARPRFDLDRAVSDRGVESRTAADWIRTRHGIGRARTIAVGNDYNDLDMLEWADRACVVSNAPASMRVRFEVVRSNDDDGFTDAVRPLLPDG